VKHWPTKQVSIHATSQGQARRIDHFKLRDHMAPDGRDLEFMVKFFNTPREGWIDNQHFKIHGGTLISTGTEIVLRHRTTELPISTQRTSGLNFVDMSVKHGWIFSHTSNLPSITLLFISITAGLMKFTSIHERNRACNSWQVLVWWRGLISLDVQFRHLRQRV
jgi:hypothetical protein